MPEAPVTFVNLVTVDPDRQEELIGILREGAEQVISRRPGLRSLRLLAALDGTRVAVIAEWDDAAAAKATQEDPKAAALTRAAAAVGTPAPGVYRLVSAWAAR
jgi:heme-degrading monooxygenase HmoA